MKSQQHQFIEIDKQIGAKIHSLRRNHGLSCHQFAKKIGVSYQQIRKYETGKNAIKIGQLLFLTKFFNVDLSYFLDTANDLSINMLKEQRIYNKITKNLAKIKNPRFYRSLDKLIVTLIEDK
jgi:transcriptional regulator with XRE-family HTH domain